MEEQVYKSTQITKGIGMSINVHATGLEGAFIIEPERKTTVYGHVQPTYQAALYASYGMTARFINDSYIRAFKGALIGLRYHKVKNAQLFSLVRGHVKIVVLDIRRYSPTFAKHKIVDITEGNGKQVYISEGFAYAICILSDMADVHIKESCFVEPEDEQSIFWHDADLAIDWPFTKPTLTAKDREAPLLGEIQEKDLPIYSDYISA